jgi:hypothetical protein
LIVGKEVPVTTDDKSTIDYLLSDDANPPSPLSATEKEAVRRLVEEWKRLRELARRSLGFVVTRLDGQTRIDVSEMEDLERKLREAVTHDE